MGDTPEDLSVSYDDRELTPEEVDSLVDVLINEVIAEYAKGDWA